MTACVTRTTLTALAARLARGEITHHALVEACLARIADPAGEGPRQPSLDARARPLPRRPA